MFAADFLRDTKKQRGCYHVIPPGDITAPERFFQTARNFQSIQCRLTKFACKHLSQLGWGTTSQRIQDGIRENVHMN